MKIYTILFLLVSSLFFVACDKVTSKDEISSEVIPQLKIIRFGRIAHTDPESLMIQYAPLMTYLTKATGVDRVDLKLYNSYEKILDELKKGNIEIGWLGTSFYAELKETNFTPLVRPVWKGKVTYQGQILTRRDSGILSLKDLKNKKFAFVSKNSTSGFVFPKMMLEAQNIKLDDLREYSFLRKHDAVVFAILSRQFQVGASYVGILDLPNFVKRKNEFRVLAKTDDISNEPIVTINNLDPSIKKKIFEVMINAGKLGLIKQVPGLDGFNKVTDKDYDSVRKLKKYVK
ncbi:MAG: hypothetical protein COB02_13290 [Candidatus Cloacimonadota bacterium]|nr:MAG: hypothetical protein COB02_13290 [Candidatus Cloacimonadota bacterium]